jgi:hypothetical protein
VVVATIAVAAIGIGTAAASGLFDRPDPQDAAAVEGLHAGEYSSHGPGWRPELMAETFICSWAPGENLHTFASSGPLAARFEAETVTAACLDNMTDSVRVRGDTTTPVLSGEPRICATTSGVYDFDPSLTNVGPFLAVVLDDRSCAAAGFSDTDVPGLLAIVNDRRAREVRFLARFNTGTCIAADEALTIAREHSSDLGADFTVRANPRGDQICFRPQVSWERHEAVLYPSRERPGSQGRD